MSPGEIDRGRRSLWRYQAALAFTEAPAVTLGEGWTPLIEASWQGRPIRCKLEFLAPTGSFKDRGNAVLINYLRRHRVAAVAEDSSGNGGASLAAYAAAAGLPCRIFAPAKTSAAKIVQIAAVGAEVALIEGSRQDVAEAARREAERVFYASHNWQPFFLEGTKTIGYELWEALGFRAPDNVVAPLGGGSIVLGCWLAFRELRDRGEVDRLPRLFGVQASACAPFHAAFAVGADDLVPTPIAGTVAEGIALSRPVRVREVLAALRVSRGSTVAVGEDEIVAALDGLAKSGLFVEPTSAAAAAGLTRLIGEGAIGAGETTVLVLTGSGLKATAAIGELLRLGAAGAASEQNRSSRNVRR